MWKEVAKRIEEFIRDVVSNAGADGVVVGISGGVDSAVTAFLCRRALGPKKVLGLIMPEVGVTPRQDIEDAKDVCRILGIDYKYIEINKIFNAFSEIFGDKESMAALNVKPRIRMTICYYYANKLNRLVAGTGNKSEIEIGYFTKYGDGGVDFLPIGDLYKTEVIELAKFLGVPERIIKKKPSAGLWKGQTDEEEIGIDYEKLDKILMMIEAGVTEGEDVKRVLSMIEKNRHKKTLPPVAPVRGLLDKI